MPLAGHLSQLVLPADYFCTALYVHVPFCFHKCHYCDFYSITRQTPERMQQFVELMLREADGWRNPLPNFVLRPRTVFIGGGTPTLLPKEQMRRLIRGLQGDSIFPAAMNSPSKPIPPPWTAIMRLAEKRGRQSPQLWGAKF